MKRLIKYIAIHCTATQPNASVQAIQNYWKSIGWKRPGYHILIDATGKAHQLAPFSEITNGVKGFNMETIHISYIGGIDKHGKPMDTRTEAQKASILTAIKQALEWSGKNLIIQGHKDFPNVNKACPSFDAKAEYKWITI